jgi:predicted transcriptional regulator
MKYRSRFDIVGAMLQASVGGATKTRLMYQAFLSHTQVDEYIGFMLGKKLISLSQDKKHYLPTEKGLRFLKMFGEIKEVVTVDHEQHAPQKLESELVEIHDITPLTQAPPHGGEMKPQARAKGG